MVVVVVVVVVEVGLVGLVKPHHFLRGLQVLWQDAEVVVEAEVHLFSSHQVLVAQEQLDQS
jgi:hypothetical protein